MQFLKTVFWVLVAVIVAVFASNNWNDVEITLWGKLVWYTKLPVPLFMAFLLGLVPTLLLYRTTRWRLRRKLDSTEKALASVQSASTPPPSSSLPPSAAPIAVPPGVS